MVFVSENDTTYYNGGVELLRSIDQGPGAYYLFSNDDSGLHLVSYYNSSTLINETENLTYNVSIDNKITLNYPTEMIYGVVEPATSYPGEIVKHSADSLNINFTTTMGTGKAITNYVFGIKLSSKP